MERERRERERVKREREERIRKEERGDIHKGRGESRVGII